MTIRKITKRREEEKFIALCKYCFPNMNNWIDNLLPFQKEDILWGKFHNEELQAGLISKSFESYLFNTRLRMSGISAVVSAPERRNSGHVRELLKHALCNDLERGLLFSSLSPFLFRFYEKMGYGYIGGPKTYTFKPEDIRLSQINGEFIQVQTSAQSRELIETHNRFVSEFDFGIEFQYNEKKYSERLKTGNIYAYIYRNKNKTRGYIEYMLIPGESFPKKMHIIRIGFLDHDSLQALFAFIRSHRNNCSDVTLSVPDNMELRQFFLEPRVRIENLSNWMARPLDMEAILNLRLRNDPCEKEIIFSVQDPIMEKNSCTYHLQGTALKKSASGNQHPIPLSTFSSLLFNSVTFDEAYSAARIDWYDGSAARYFSKKRPVYLSAIF